MAKERRNFGLMPHYDPEGSFIGLLREFPDLAVFVEAVQEYDGDQTDREDFTPCWLAWRCDVGDDGHPVYGFTVVKPGGRGATPGWGYRAYVPQKWTREAS